MTSLIRVTAHPKPGLQCEAHIQDYSNGEVSNTEVRVIGTGTTVEFAVYDGRQITFSEAPAPEPEKPEAPTEEKVEDS